MRPYSVKRCFSAKTFLAYDVYKIYKGSLIYTCNVGTTKLMDLDRIVGIVFGLLILLAVFLLPFGSFRLPSGQPSETTFFNTVRQLVESIITDVQQPANLLLYNILIVISFIFSVMAGLLGFYPMRSGVMGIFGMMLITVVSMFNPQLGFNIPSYGAGFFTAWTFSIAGIVIGKIQPQMRRKLSFLSSKASSKTAVEQPVENVSPPASLFKPLSASEEPPPQASPSSQDSSQSPPIELFSSLSTPDSVSESSQSLQVIPLPSPPVDINVIEEEISRIKVFMAILKEEKNNNIISEEAYDRLRAKLEKVVSDLEKEMGRTVKTS